MEQQEPDVTIAKSNHSLIPWLGDRRGYLSDWITQRWVETTGIRIDLDEQPWLRGPMGKSAKIGAGYFADLAREEGLEIATDSSRVGLIPNLSVLASPTCNTGGISPAVIDFYEHTSSYNMDVSGKWCGPFGPFGAILALIFWRRLQQFNIPLTSADTASGITSQVVQLLNKDTGEVAYTAWIRELVANHNVMYAGSYSTCDVPYHPGQCVKLVFPLPNGNAVVLLKPESNAGGLLTLSSSGGRFGCPGLYFVVRNAKGVVSAKYVRAMCEKINVWAEATDEVSADHVFKVWGITFLRLHYRLTRKL